MKHPTPAVLASLWSPLRKAVMGLGLLAVLCTALPAHAQGRGGGVGVGVGVGPGGGLGHGVPGGGLGGLPQLPSWPTPAGEGVGRKLDETARHPRSAADTAQRAAAAERDGVTGRRSLGISAPGVGPGRRHRIEERLILHPERLTLDAQGELAVRGELVIADPPADLLKAARVAGFRVLREHRLAELDLRWVVLATPPGLAVEEAREQLQALLPPGAGAATAAPHHLYLPVESSTPGTRAGSGALAATDGEAAVPLPARSETARAQRVGLVDGGVDAGHPALRSTRVLHHGCRTPVPSPHGTAVASLLVGHDGAFAGAVRAPQLHAADVYCGAPTGGSLEAVVTALAWMARERVPVVNLSLVGPANPVLQRAVAALVARGHLLVAAVGNDGPASPPLFPAAYPGVVGVTAVDRRRRLLPEAVQGPQVAFAAPGADLAVAEPGGGYASARGTSFAAPLVTGLLASRLKRPDAGAAQAALDALRRLATDLGTPGTDSVFGHGLVGEALRTDPRAVTALR